MFGLRDEDLKYIIARISEFKEIEKAYIFGSRAKGNYKNSSDIAIEGAKIDFNIVSKLHGILEDESPMPYMFDILDLEHTKNENIIDHVRRVGVEIFSK